MFALDHAFLASAGITGLPEDAERSLLATVYKEMETRVGIRLSEGLSDAQLAEFEQFIDGDQGAVDAWLAVHAPDPAADPIFRKMLAIAGADADPAEVRAEFAATKWLAVNRPDYQGVVRAVLAELKDELAANAALLSPGTAG